MCLTEIDSARSKGGLVFISVAIHVKPGEESKDERRSEIFRTEIGQEDDREPKSAAQ
jgi:hypothetical protein